MPDAPAGPSLPSAVIAIAPAKINLALEVTGKRNDGYHEIDTVMSTLDLTDRVRVSAHPTLEVRLDGPASRGIDPTDDLSGRAAQAIAQAAGRAPNLLIEVTKRIPSPAGLGGGSSDAAAVIRAVDALWGLGWSAERLATIGARVGSDVPFFVHGGTAHCTGRGEQVEPLRDLKPMRMLVLVPPVLAAAQKTALRYAALTRHDFTDGHRAWRLAQRIARGAPPPTNDLVNVFEASIERTDAELLAHYATFRAAGAPQLHLCGSGPAVYTLINEGIRIAQFRQAFEAVGAQVFEAHTTTRAHALALTREP